jgi:hypothetical protein
VQIIQAVGQAAVQALGQTAVDITHHTESPSEGGASPAAESRAS